MLVILYSIPSNAGCDMCSMYLGLNPNYNSNTIGLRYKYSSYTDKGMHHHMPDGGEHHHEEETMPGKTYTREFQTTELFALYYPTPEIQLMAFVPYMNNHIYYGEQLQEVIMGMGDASILGRYQLYNTSNDTASFRQRIFAGAGIKLPTGVFNAKGNDGMLDPHIQPGTGSTDVLFSLSYLCKFKKVGFNTDFNYRLNTVNKNEYNFADRFSNTSTLFYSIDAGSLVLMPGAGLYAETAGYDMDHKVEMTTTNGTIFNASFGLDIYMKRFSLNFNYQLPLKVDLNDAEADHQGRAMAGLNYSF